MQLYHGSRDLTPIVLSRTFQLPNPVQELASAARSVSYSHRHLSRSRSFFLDRRHQYHSSKSTHDKASPSTPNSDSHALPRNGSSKQGQTKEQKASHVTDWDDHPDLSISNFSELPEKNLGVNQHMIINNEFKKALRQIIWRFRAPIRYAVAYGSGVFPQQRQKKTSKSSTHSTLHPNAPDAIAKAQDGEQKMVDFIFGVSYSQHWHSLNLHEHRDHYSAVGSLGSYAVSKLQDSFGAGIYFNPYVAVDGTLIKYGVVNMDTLCRDLSEWDTLYLAGRLQKPVKILRDHPSVRLANQVNLISALRTALLLLPPDFTELELYSTIASISYMGDLRMSLLAEDARKVLNIVQSQLPKFRALYAPVIETLPNISFNDSACKAHDWFDNPDISAKLAQDMDPVKRGNMVRRLPKRFREKLYFEYQGKFGIPRVEFDKMMQECKENEDGQGFKKQQGGLFEQRIAKDREGIKTEVRQVIEKTIRWPTLVQTLKGLVTAGVGRSWRYIREKRAKHLAREAQRKEQDARRVMQEKKTSKKA